MAFIDWDDRFSVGIAQFDSDHRALVGLMNGLAEAAVRGEGALVLSTTVDAVMVDVKAHFDSEERAMAEHGYPEYAHHKAEHDRLLADVAELWSRLQKSESPVLPTLQFFKGWLAIHVVETDQRYAAFLQSKGMR